MKIWFDILTPKQLLFFESMIQRAKSEHDILFTSRDYEEVTDLIRIRNLHPTLVGKYGGKELEKKLDASLMRAKLLIKLIDEFQPDITVSFCSPEASLISFNFGIYHIAFCNAPHSEGVCRLAVPLLNKLLIPGHIPKQSFGRYGLEHNHIVQYAAMDEFLIVRNKPAFVWDKKSIGLSDSKKTILFRTYETQASYVQSHTNMEAILDSIVDNFSDCNIVISTRYSEQTEHLQERYSDVAVTLESSFDSGAILAGCDLLIGSGGTMTTEAVLRGVPVVSYDAVPNMDEKYLVNRGALVRAKSPDKIIKASSEILSKDKRVFVERADCLLSEMEDPYDTLVAQINEYARTIQY